MVAAALLLGASLALTPAQLKQIDGVVAQVMQADHIPGLSLGIARKGKVLLARGYGLRDVDKQAPADAKTIYRIGSITKQFTAALVLQESDRGALPANAAMDGYTISQLLSQTTGLVSYTDPGQTLDSAMNAPPNFTPGSQWQYSNSNYYLLGNALESATHTSYADLIQTRICKPLHLTSTALALPAGPDVAQGYAWDGTQFAPATPGPNATPALAFSASGLSSNVVDLLRWLGGLADSEVVPSDTFEEMTTSGALPDGTLTHYGYGFFIDDWYGWAVAEHPGLIDGYSGGDAISLGDDLALVVLTNENQVSLTPLEKSIFAILDKPKDRALVADLASSAQNEDPATSAAVKAVAASLAAGSLDRSALTPALSARTPDGAARADAALVRPLGAVKLVEFIEVTHLGGVTYEDYRVSFEHGVLLFTVSMKDDKIDSLAISRPQ